MSKRNYWTEERFLREYHKHPFLKNYKILKGFESVEEHIIIEGEVTNHFFAPKEITKINSLSISNSTDKRKFKIHQFNTIHNYRYSYENYEFVKNAEYMKFICSVHGEKSIPQNNHMKGFGCNECSIKGAPSLTKEEFEYRIKEVPEFFKILGEYEGYHHGILCENKYGLLTVSPQSMFKGHFGSIKTALNKQEYKENQLREIHSNKYTYPNFKYENNHSVIEIKCDIHGIFTQKSYVHQMGHGCQQCADENRIWGYSRSDFRNNAKGRKCTAYIIRCWNDAEEFYKVGITMRTVKKRFAEARTMPYQYEILALRQSYDANSIYDLENELLRKYKKYFYIPLLYFKGETECFSADIPVEEIIKTLKNLHTSK